MTIEELLLAAKLADLDRDIAGAALARTLTELRGGCRCAHQSRTDTPRCARHAVDPSLFRRLVWAGLRT